MTAAPATAPPLALAAKFPFLPGTAELVGTRGPPLQDLLFDRAYARVRSRGLARVQGAVLDTVIPSEEATSESDALVEMLSYGVGRMLIAALDLPWAARRSAMAEAKLAHERLLKEDESVVREVATRLGLKLQPATGGHAAAVHAADFLKNSVQIKEPTWKLVNQRLRKGYVELDKAHLARLCQEAVRLRVEQAAQHEAPPEVAKAFEVELPALRKLGEEQMAKFQGGDMGPATLELLPPCMKKLLAQLQQGVNVPHTGRFAVTSFLHTIGLGTEDIMRLFSAAPDFKEEMTRYQVEHITGKTSGTEYTPPGCSSLVTWGLCPMEELARDQRDRFCVHPKMTHPLVYYRWKVNDEKRFGPRTPAAPTTAPTAAPAPTTATAAAAAVPPASTPAPAAKE